MGEEMVIIGPNEQLSNKFGCGEEKVNAEDSGTPTFGREDWLQRK